MTISVRVVKSLGLIGSGPVVLIRTQKFLVFLRGKAHFTRAQRRRVFTQPRPKADIGPYPRALFLVLT